MAGDWIKMRSNLWDDPRVSALCDATGAGEAAVVGALYWLWATADQHSEDGTMPGLTLRQIDRKTGVPGFAQAMCAIGWLHENPQGVVIEKFEEHNGASAKKRCQTAKRVASFRGGNADVTQEALQEEDETVSGALAREEKRREEEKEISEPTVPRRKPAASVPCPSTEIIRLYHEALPELPAVRVETAARQKALRAFWVWVLTSKRSDGTARAQNADEALAWVGEYFRRVRQNDFLMGRGGRGDTHANWRPDLEFLLSDKGKKHVIEKTQEAA